MIGELVNRLGDGRCVRTKRVAVIAAMLFAVVAGEACRGEEAADAKFGKRVSFTAIEYSLEYTVSVPAYIESFHKIPVTITVKNIGRELAHCGDTGSGPVMRWKLVARGNGEREVPFTPSGNHYFGDNIQRFGFSLCSLKPGEAKTWTTNLAEHFEPLRRGNYEFYPMESTTKPLPLEIRW